MTPEELLTQALAKLQTANRIDGSRNSFKKDSPLEYQGVVAYLNGGTRPQVASDMGVGLALVEDARRALGVVVDPPDPPDPPDPTPGAKPLTAVISSGGTYSGTIRATQPGPAVRIATAEPVVIENSTIEHTLTGSDDHLLSQTGSAAQITVRRCTFTGPNAFPNAGFGRAMRFEMYKSVVVENCTITRTGGLYFLSPGSGATIVVRRNKMRNVCGNGGSAKRQFLQLNGASTAIAEWNEVINEPGISYSEDVFSVYKTSNVILRNNYVQGGYPYPLTNPHQGTGMLLSDAGGDNNLAHDNQIVGVTNVGMGIAAGNNNTIRDNRVVSDGKTPDGVSLPASNLGVYAYMASGLPMSNNIIKGNHIGWMKPGSRNDIWAPEADNNVNAENTFYYGNHSTPITKADEEAEWPRWVAKLQAAGIVIGA